MFYFYVLQSLSDKFMYYGSTSDLTKRLAYHNSGKVKSTKSKMPYKIKYYEAYETLALARQRETNIKKNWAAKEELKKRFNK
jgi:putative endonuclease